MVNLDALVPVAAETTLHCLTIGPCRYTRADGEQPGQTLLRAVRDWARLTGRPDPDTLNVRNTRLHWKSQGEYSCTCFVGRRRGESWIGRYVWIQFCYQPTDVMTPPHSAGRPPVEIAKIIAALPHSSVAQIIACILAAGRFPPPTHPPRDGETQR
jgi:hypothetical protein